MLREKVSTTKDAGIKAEIEARIVELDIELEDLQILYDQAQMAFNGLAKETMALEADRVTRETAYNKALDFEDAKREVERYEKQIADLEARIADFSTSAKDNAGGNFGLPACDTNMYTLDMNMIPQVDYNQFDA